MELLLDVGVTNTFGLFFFNVCFPPWGENAYYFAHNRHFEIPEDAKIISGPGLVTGGSPEKIQELVDSLWVGWIDLMVTKIHQKKTSIHGWSWNLKVGCINCDSLWFMCILFNLKQFQFPLFDRLCDVLKRFQGWQMFLTPDDAGRWCSFDQGRENRVDQGPLAKVMKKRFKSWNPGQELSTILITSETNVKIYTYCRIWCMYDVYYDR